jgi:hypothetical protein
MKTIGVIFVLFIGLRGFVAAEWFVTGNCYANQNPAVFQTFNGNCVKGKDDYYETIILATTAALIFFIISRIRSAILLCTSKVALSPPTLDADHLLGLIFALLTQKTRSLKCLANLLS